MQRIRTWEMIPAELRVRNRTLPVDGGDGSTLSLDFTAMASLDSRFTFARSSNATYVNSDGIIAFADNNLVVNSTFGSSATPQGWSGSTGVSLTTPSVGVRRAVTTTAAQNWIQTSNIATSIGLTYSTSVYVNEVSGQHYANTVTITASPTSVTYYRNGVSVGQFETAQPGLISMTWTASTGFGHGLRVGIGATGANVASAVCEFTEPRTSRGTNAQPTYFANTSTASAYYAPRFDYSPTTLTARGLLIEAAATNYALSSEAFSTSYWGNNGLNGSAPTSTSQTNPTNTASSIQFVEDTSTGTHGAYQSVSGLTAGTVYTLSAWVKSDGTRNFASLRLTVSGGSPSYSAVWSLTDGTPGNTLTTGSPTSTARSIDAYPNGWYRIQISMACPVGFTAMLGYVNGSNTNTLTNQPQSYTGTATKGIYVWGAQFEVGGGATSYIQTGTSTVQRVAESCAIALSSFGFNTSAGTLFADWYRKNSDSGSQGGGPWNTDYVSARWLGVLNAIADNTVSLSSWSGATNIANGATRNKAAATYGAWTGSVVPTTFCVNNSAVTSANRDFNPSTATYLTIGAASSSAGTSPAYGVATRDWLNNSIRSIKYWPSILPDATLQSITA